MGDAAIAFKNHVFDRSPGQLAPSAACFAAGGPNLLERQEVVLSVTLHVQVPCNRIARLHS